MPRKKRVVRRRKVAEVVEREALSPCYFLIRDCDASGNAVCSEHRVSFCYLCGAEGLKRCLRACEGHEGRPPEVVGEVLPVDDVPDEPTVAEFVDMDDL